MKKQRKEAYVAPGMSEMDFLQETCVAASPVRFDARIQEFNSIDGEAPEEGEVDYLF